MARPAYRLLHHSLWDLVPITMGLAHFVFVIWLVTAFHSLSGWALSGRSIPSLLSRCSSVLGCSPNRSAAFDLPLMRQPHSCNTRRT